MANYEEPADDEDLLARAKRCFKLACEAESKQRDREKDDLRFQVPELQWNDDARRQREGSVVDGVPTPARPILSIPKLDQPIQLVLNQQVQAHLGVKLQPLSPDADDEIAEILQGLYRSIERDSQAHGARGWAFDRAVKAGRGFYLVTTEYDEAGGHPFDQVIRIKRIRHQDAVYIDPAAQEADYSDAKWGFLVSWVRIPDFRKEYPQAQVGEADTMDFADMVREAPDWVRGDGEKDGAVLVAMYWYKDSEFETVEAEGPDGEKLERKREKVSVRWCKLTGFEVLEEGEWNGKYIPLIPVLGRELQPFDAERRYVGIIGPAKDAQRLYNYAASSAIEVAALEPKAPWVMAEGQDEGYESEWQQSNIRNFPALHYKPTSHGGQPVAPPQRSQVDVGRLGPSMQLLQQADNFIQTSTNTFDPSLGRLNSKERSGRAILALQEQSDASSSHYLQSLAKISMAYEAKVVLDLIPAIYDRPGRLARTLDTEDDTEMVMLNQPFYVDPKTKRPVPVEVVRGPDGEPVEPLTPADPRSVPPRNTQPGAPPCEIKYYDMRKGVYSVAIDIGRSKQTLVQEGVEEIGAILQAAPQLMPIIGPTYFKFRDFPGAPELAEMLAKMRDKQYPGLSGDDDGPTAEQAQAQVQQLQQQMQMMQAQLQGAMKALETEQAKQQATIQKTAMDNESRERIAAMNNETKLAIEGLTAQMERMQLGLEHANEERARQEEMAHEVAMSAAAGRTMNATFESGEPEMGPTV